MRRYASVEIADCPEERAILAVRSFLAYANVAARMCSFAPDAFGQMESKEQIEARARQRCEDELAFRCKCGGFVSATLRDGFEFSSYKECLQCRQEAQREEAERRATRERNAQLDSARRAVLRASVTRKSIPRDAGQFFAAVGMAGAINEAKENMA